MKMHSNVVDALTAYSTAPNKRADTNQRIGWNFDKT